MSFKIDDETRLNFDKMLKESGASDNTAKIRKLRHSSKINEQVSIMMDIRKKYQRLGKKSIDRMIDSQCSWLYKNYTNIFIRLKKNELDLDILGNLIICLKEIEDNKIDQHEASVKVGKILKKLFIDSAMKREKKMEKKLKKEEKKFVKPKVNISWSDYKKTL
tara:strand:- start:9462 stop:9950 length:489 start_codon:yes stop_codon:yes gene_type:complete